MYSRFKRGIDISISLLAIIVLSPIFLLTALLIRLETNGKIIFKQKRIGLNGKVFDIYKFRSMYENSEHTGSGVYSGKNDSRVTKVGKIIRATSIDELPQLINILKGDMSLIGPRPPLTYHPWPFDQYSEEQKKMFAVRPGITGWAQINGRKDVEWNRRIELNVWYVDHMNFWIDIKIFFATIFKVLQMKDNNNIQKTVAENSQVFESVGVSNIAETDVHNER